MFEFLYNKKQTLYPEQDKGRLNVTKEYVIFSLRWHYPVQVPWVEALQLPLSRINPAPLFYFLISFIFYT
jgi:hypothetical protein